MGRFDGFAGGLHDAGGVASTLAEELPEETAALLSAHLLH
jgi:hypothetical protein